MALVYENFESYENALIMWQKFQGAKGPYLLYVSEGCERTVAILRRLKNKDKLKTYGKWVLE